MPQAASLLARMRESKHMEKMLKTPLDHIWFWYDCACLPQRFPRDRTEEENLEFGSALRQLDRLVDQCELLCLRTPGDDYSLRAWCSFEHFLKSLTKFDRAITLDCERFEQRANVKWFLRDDDESPPLVTIARGHQLQEKIKDIHSTFARKRHKEFNSLQWSWEGMVLNASFVKPSEVPDMCDAMHRIHYKRIAVPQTSPFQQAMEQLVKELQSVIFSLSCRDAASFANVPVPAELNVCIPGVGIQCGLHHNGAEDISFQSRLQDRIASCMKDLQFVPDDRTSASIQPLVCPNGHSLLPRVAACRFQCDSTSCRMKDNILDAGQVEVACVICDYDLCFDCSMSMTGVPFKHVTSSSSQEALEMTPKPCGAHFPSTKMGENDYKHEFCERRVTIDLYDLIKSTLATNGQHCTNEGDLAFVGLLALKNLLQRGQPQGEEQQNALIQSAGLLCHLQHMTRTAVEMMSSVLAKDEPISSFYVTVVLNVPRWVLLDLANAATELHSVFFNEAVVFGPKAHQYLMDNPESVSFSFQHDEASASVRRIYCMADPLCRSAWMPCKHTIQDQIQKLLVSTSQTPSTLDPWVTTELPSTLAFFGCVVAEDRIFVIGGATGDKDPVTHKYTTYSPHVYVSLVRSKIDMVKGVSWSRAADLNQARRGHAACTVKDNGGRPSTLVVKGGRSSTVSGIVAPMLSSIELLRLDRDDNEWKSGATMPCKRAGHHMAAVGGSLFIFGGLVEDPSQCRDCDILNFERRVWLPGPQLPTSILGGGLALIQDRFAAVFGGISATLGALSTSWVLDLLPWAEWTARGGAEGQQPTGTTWMQGPDLSAPNSWPNICVASASDSGRKDDWILSVASLQSGNVCVGLRLDPSTITE